VNQLKTEIDSSLETNEGPIHTVVWLDVSVQHVRSVTGIDGCHDLCEHSPDLALGEGLFPSHVAVNVFIKVFSCAELGKNKDSDVSARASKQKRTRRPSEFTYLHEYVEEPIRLVRD
jgi:hypothetical protein